MAQSYYAGAIVFPATLYMISSYGNSAYKTLGTLWGKEQFPLLEPHSTHPVENAALGNQLTLSPLLRCDAKQADQFQISSVGQERVISKRGSLSWGQIDGNCFVIVGSYLGPYRTESSHCVAAIYSTGFLKL